jgi:hypothetical protein
MFYNLDAETLTVHFINKFTEPPALIIFPCLLDVSSRKNLRLDIVPTVTTTNFRIKANGSNRMGAKYYPT